MAPMMHTFRIGSAAILPGCKYLIKDIITYSGEVIVLELV